jgi:hypothetical protein
MAVEAAVLTVVGAAAFMVAVAEVRIAAAAECLAEARHEVAAVSAEAADRLAAGVPQARVSLSGAAANRADSRWVGPAAMQAGRAAAQRVQAELQQLTADLAASAETDPATLAQRTMPAMVLRTGNGIHSAIALAAVELRARREEAQARQMRAAFTRQV